MTLTLDAASLESDKTATSTAGFKIVFKSSWSSCNSRQMMVPQGLGSDTVGKLAESAFHSAWDFPRWEMVQLLQCSQIADGPKNASQPIEPVCQRTSRQIGPTESKSIDGILKSKRQTDRYPKQEWQIMQNSVIPGWSQCGPVWDMWP